MGNFPADCSVAQPGAVQLHAEEEDKCSRVLGLLKINQWRQGPGHAVFSQVCIS